MGGEAPGYGGSCGETFSHQGGRLDRAEPIWYPGRGGTRTLWPGRGARATSARGDEEGIPGSSGSGGKAEDRGEEFQLQGFHRVSFATGNPYDDLTPVEEPAQRPQPPLEERGPAEESPTILLEVQGGTLTEAVASAEPETMEEEASRLDELVASMEVDMPLERP
ncbi:hypothetical protein CBR_g28762 [Chara braunii]|uniref:Uncharacterized protein n=1 Tax=Chara braunii TaxID=69332 RepID=A0A388L9T5_CHABU|nr:hypothetical protein CBR_g28762 [Chara braunii]|eukprot:GBG79048.1 hypothetical protein CBR_g28762 [Chara braunii]